MNSARPVEHFVTLFDSHYLPLGLCLHRSLEEHARPFHLWIVAIDDACADALARIPLRHVTVLRLAEVENDALRTVKAGRSVGEYCWTLTPFLPSTVFARAPQVERITYLDADLFFFQPPGALLDEFARSGKQVLITEHAFAPEHAPNLRYGRFCVQFMTFRNTSEAARVLRWWQDRCIEWCYNREEDGKFGDQKYLDDWPERFAAEVHVLSRTEATLAPWNVAHFARRTGDARPVFYHFHSLKIVSGSRVVLYFRWQPGRASRWIYAAYLKCLRATIEEMRRRGIPVIGPPLLGGEVGALRAAYVFGRAYLGGRADWAAL
jgi:hypothetical protein